MRGSLTDILHLELPFLIPKKTLPCHPPFVYGNTAYAEAVDSILSHHLVGTSEHAVISFDSHWIGIFESTLDAVIVRDQSHASSATKLRPDAVVEVRGALALRVEGKALATQLKRAGQELVEKMIPSATGMFPIHQLAIPSYATSGTTIQLYSIWWDAAERGFQGALLKQYLMTNEIDRVKFVVDLFKIVCWMSTIQGPVTSFHLTPNIAIKTRNGHLVTWTQRGIMKKHSVTINVEILGRIYAADLNHVERGEVVSTREVLITSVGIPIGAVIQKGEITCDVVKGAIGSAVDELHKLGIAHCDIRPQNVFYVDGVVRLGDLEYCREMASKSPRNLKWSDSSATSAEHLDIMQLGKFCAALDSGNFEL